MTIKKNINRKFSIIIPFYNTSNFLKYSILSVINQTLNFEENVELILVDDGSEDNSKEIALSFKERYPDNIIVLSQKHAGQASAKNFGLGYVSGEYVHFLDSDDYLSDNTLKDVLNFFNSRNRELNIVAIPMYYFELCDKSHKLNNKFDFNRIIDLNESPKQFLLSSSQVFIKAEFLTDFSFNDSLMFSDSRHFILKILAKDMKYGIVTSAKYFYRKRADLTAVSDNRKFNKDYFLNILKHFHFDIINHFKVVGSDLPKFIQYAFVYDFQDFIKQYDTKVLNDDELNEVHVLLHDIFKYIDNDVIINTKNINFMLKSYLCYLKSNQINLISDENQMKLMIGDLELDNLNLHKIWIDKLNINTNSITFSGFFNSYFNNDMISIEILKKWNDNECIIKNSDFDSSFVTTSYLGDDWHFSNRFSFNIPLLDEFYKFNLKFVVKLFKDGDKSNLDDSNIVINEILIDFKNNIEQRLSSDNFEVIFKDNTFFINRIFNFSIIVAIYNTEEYLSQAIDSVINQNLNFKDNVQLILVDDGSEDNSMNIALDYQKKYPMNIIVLSKENGGQASARNLGIKYASGRYLNFLDSDDYLSQNALQDVFEFFEKYPDVDVVAIPMMYFGRRVQEHILNGKFNNSRVILLEDEPNNPLLSCSSSFLRKSALGDDNFDIHLSNLEDALLINKLLLKNSKYGVINSSTYYYRKRFDSSSTTDTSGVDSKNYVNRLKRFYLNLINQSISKYGKVRKFIQYLLIYDLQWLMDSPELELDETDTKEFWYYFDKVMENIHADSILNNDFLIDNKKLFLYYLKVKDLHTEFSEDNVLLKINNRQLDNLKEHWFWLDIVELDDSLLNISGFLNSHFDIKNTSVEAVKVNSSGDINKFRGDYVKYSARANIHYLSVPWRYRYNFDVSIPISESESSEIKLKVNYHKDGDNNNFDAENLVSVYLSIGLLKHAHLSELSNYKLSDKFLLKFEENTIKIMPKTNIGLIHSEKTIIKSFFKQYRSKKQSIFLKSIFFRLIYVVGTIFKINRKPIYLFMDRIESADDNAEALFRYAVSIDDNIKKYFIIDKNSKDYSRISKIGNVLGYRSFKHMLLYLFAEKIISSHPDEELLNPFYYFGNGELFSGLINVKSYFLQHGVTLGNVSKWLHNFDKNLKLIVTVSEDETNSFFTEGYNFDENVVQLLGFPRFDNLINNQKKQILLMPTWRKGVEQSKDAFINSEYFHRLNEILNNKLLINYCDEFGYDIIFKPHPRLNLTIPGDDDKFIDLININDKIILSDESYNTLFNESSLLITDYSSVAFDFAYLKKPIIYYQPDNDYHHEKSYFDFDKMGFGEVVKSEERLLALLKNYLANGCEMEKSYEIRVNQFYKYTDNKNCKRVYDWIKGH